MSMKMIGGLVAFVMGTVVGGCSGADTQKPDTASQEPADTSSGASGANLPPASGTTTSGGTGATAGAPQSAPAAGGAALPGAAPGGAAPGGMAGGQNGAPGQPGAGAGGGVPGAGGGGGAGEDLCCYNNMAYDCPDAKSCLGGFDVDACEAACADGDFKCEIACVDMLSKAGGPTNACVAKGPC